MEYFSGQFQHVPLHIIGDSLQAVIRAVALLRCQVICTSGEIKTGLPFILGKADDRSEIESQYNLIAAHLKKK